jgi:CRP-like cAMP-binding protein
MNNERTFHKGDVIFRQGDSGDSFFKIIRGTVEVIADYEEPGQHSLTVLKPGEYFGEMAAVDSYPRSTTIVANEDLTVKEISRPELSSFLKNNPDMINELMRQLGKRIRELSEDYNELRATIKNVEESENKKSESLLAKVKKYIDFYASGKNNITKPSAEELREGSNMLMEQRTGKMETYSKGTIIFKQGDKGRCMYILYGGTVGIYTNYATDNQVRLTELYPVAFFGEMAMIADEARSATAVADTEDTYVEIIYPEDLENLFRKSPLKIDMILKHLSNRLRNLTYDYLLACKKLNDIYKS